MNWLAHLRLAPAPGLVRVGCLAGDFVRGVDLTTLPPALVHGIRHHRAVDRFVDAHPVVAQSRRRVSPPLRRFAGVLVDVFYDHFLAREWGQHGDGGPLPQFAAAVHAELTAHSAVLPPDLQRVAPRLAEQRWLLAYGSLDGMRTILQAMSRRLARENGLGLGGDELRRDYEAFAGDFGSLWPELVRFAGDGWGRDHSQ